MVQHVLPMDASRTWCHLDTSSWGGLAQMCEALVGPYEKALVA